MVCVTCGANNEPGTKFCGQCGSRLAAACANCGSALKDGVRFCGECGTPVTASASPGAQTTPAVPGGTPSISRPTPVAITAEPVSERRIVTVLFADLIGFTPFAEERDAEEVRETLSRYFDVARETVGRYGGTIEKFIGDAVMAVWGTPTSHEDDAERAVRAAMELVEAVPSVAEGVAARAGVLTGEAVVTLGATDQGMVAGDLVNTASRLQSMAPAGAVLVGEATYRAASKAIAFEAAGEQLLKGKSTPLPAWRALRIVAERGGRNRAETLEAPFVGREPELRLLKDMLHATSRERRARLVSVTGIAGIGKSRLGWEFEKYLDGLIETVRWHAGRSPAYGEGVTFWALGEMVRSRAGLLETDDQATTRAKVATSVAQWVPDEAERRWIESALLALLGAGDPPAGGREGLFAAWRTYFERIAAQDVVTMVFEDLHWADAGLLDFIDHLLEWSRDYPIYILTLARPELLDRRPDWGAGKRNFTAIALEPLAPTDMRDLLAGLVPGLPKATETAIVARAEGIPLYAVEMVRVLVADGKLVEADGSFRPVGDLGHITVPETLHGLISARLDALDPADRSLLQDAAVLGQSFTPAGLGSITGTPPEELEPRLRALVRREVLAHKGDPRSPERGQYSFVQALIREVAYNTLAKPERKSRHLAAARWFETLGEEELAGALAAHYLAAYQNAPPGPESDALAAQARIALRGAGDRAADLGSHDQAIRFWDQALTVSPSQVEKIELLTRSAEAATIAARHDIAERRARDALALEVAGGDRVAVAAATALLGRVLLNAYRTPDALEELERAYSEFTDLAAEPNVIRLGGQLARAYFFSEQNRRALEVSDVVLEAAEHAHLVPVIADTLITKGSALANVGRAYEGVGAIRAGQELAAAYGLTDLIMRAVANRSGFESIVDPRAAYQTAFDGLNYARRLGWPVNASLLVNFAETAVEIGDWDGAMRELNAALEGSLEPVDLIQLALSRSVIEVMRGRDGGSGDVEELARTGGHGDVGAFALLDLDAWRAAAHGRLADAYDKWLEYARVSMLNAPESLAMAARMALWERDRDRAAHTVELLDATGLHGPAVDTVRAVLRAGLLALDGRRSEASTAYREGQRTLADLGLVLSEALSAIDMLSVLGPQDPEARAAGEKARATFARLDALPFLRRLDGLMAERRDEASTVVATGEPESVRLAGA